MLLHRKYLLYNSSRIKGTSVNDLKNLDNSVIRRVTPLIKQRKNWRSLIYKKMIFTLLLVALSQTGIAHFLPVGVVKKPGRISVVTQSATAKAIPMTIKTALEPSPEFNYKMNLLGEAYLSNLADGLLPITPDGSRGLPTPAPMGAINVQDEFNYGTTGILHQIASDTWLREKTTDSPVSVVAKRLTIPGRAYSEYALNFTNTTHAHDYLPITNAPISLEANVPFYFGTYFNVSSIGSTTNQIRSILRVDDGTNVATGLWIRQQVMLSNGNIVARLGLGNSGSNHGQQIVAAGQTFQFVVKGVWDGNTTIKYWMAINPGLDPTIVSWVRAGTSHTVPNKLPKIGRFLIGAIKSPVTANNAGYLGPVRISDTYSNVVVASNVPPTLIPAVFEIAQDAAASTVVGNVTATDPENGVLTYAITDGNTNNIFRINETTGQLVVVDTLTVGTYNLTVQATDNGSPVQAATAQVTINVNQTLPVVANLSVSATSLDFGLQEVNAASPPVTVTLTHGGETGSAPINIEAIISDNATFAVVPPADTVLNPQATTTFAVTFTPTTADTTSGILSITHDGANNPLTITLTGQGVVSAVDTLGFTPDSLNFTVAKDSTAASQNATLTASSGTPAITLTPSDSSSWLVLPANALGNLSFGIDATGLDAGTYSAIVSATAQGYQPDSLIVNLTVTQRPYVVSSTPVNGDTNVDISDLTISANNLYIPEGKDLDKSTVNTNTVKLFRLDSTGNEVEQIAGGVNDTGGGDAISFSPNNFLSPNTTYKFVLTDGIKLVTGELFLPYAAVFTTGAKEPTPPVDLTGVAFNKDTNIGTNLTGRHSSLVIGPDRKLYASTIQGTIKRWTIMANGSLTDYEELTPELKSSRMDGTAGQVEGRTIIGMVFDPAATADNLIAYITHSKTANFDQTSEDPLSWDGKISQLSGTNLLTVKDVVIGLPRSRKDHLTNSLTFKPGEPKVIYFSQGSNSAGGEYDNYWRKKENLLSGAILRLDLDKLPESAWPLDAKTTDNVAVINNAPDAMSTMSDGTYNPYSSASPLTIFGSGIRNGYDLLWHSNGQLYVPANGTAGGSNSPASANYVKAANDNKVRRPDGSFYNHTDFPVVPAITGNSVVQKDWLLRVVQGGYYGHPNPYRGEFVLNHGGQEYQGIPGQTQPYVDVPNYPDMLGPDPNYRNAAFDFGLNKSPNGVIEYQSNVFNGRLKGLLMVARFSNGNDLILLHPDELSKDIANAYLNVPGLGGFDDPLDLVEDTASGNLYVSEFDRDDNGNPSIALLRPATPATSQPVLTANTSRLVIDDVIDGQATSQKITLSNTGSAKLVINGIASNNNLFATQVSQFPLEIEVGDSLDLQISFNAAANGPVDAILTISSNDADSPFAAILLAGLGKQGVGGENEPSLQWVLTAHGINVNVGDDDPATTILNSQSTQYAAPLLGDELSAPLFTQALDAPVTVQVLSVYGPTSQDTVMAFGWYLSGTQNTKNELFAVSNTPSSNGQTLNPVLAGNTQFNIDGDTRFGFYSRWPAFANQEIYSEDKLNTFAGAIPHHVRVYPMPEEVNAYIIAMEEPVAGFDFQDIVVIVRNVKPAVADTLRIDFQPPAGIVFRGVPTSGATHPSYLADLGQAYNATRGYGWIDPTTKTPKANQIYGRERSGSDELRLRSFLNMRHVDAGSTQYADWECNIANGVYEITVAVGDADPNSISGNHYINVEGVSVINNFVATTTNKYKVATDTVEVTDGKLTIDANGNPVNNNTRICYLDVRPLNPNNDITAPVVAIHLNGTLDSASVYRNESRVTVAASDRSGAGLTSIQYSLDNGPFVPYLSPVRVDTEGSHRVRAKATDGKGKETVSPETTFRIVKPVASNAKMLLENRDKFPADDQLTFSLLRTPFRRTNTPYNSDHDSIRVRIHNKGFGTLRIDNLILSRPNSYRIRELNSAAYNPATSLPVAVNPGAYVDMIVSFVNDPSIPVSRVVVQHDTLTIISNDDVFPVKKLTLHSLLQKQGEGTSEPNVNEIIAAFGFKSRTGYSLYDNSQGNSYRTSTTDEIAASYFTRANPSQPVLVRQLGAYHSCCASTETVQWYAKGSTTNTTVLTHIGVDAQSLLPRKGLPNTPGEGTFSPTNAFGIKVYKSYSDRARNPDGKIGLRFFKAIDKNNKVIPNAYIMAMDYIGQPNITNYDYQDNVYFVSNIRPETGSPGYAELATADSDLDFGVKNVGSITTLPLTLRSLGITTPADPNVLITSVEVAGQHASEFGVAMPTDTILSPQETATLNVQFAPNGVGVKNAVVLVHYNNALSPLRIPVYGVGQENCTTVTTVKRIKSGSNAEVTINGNQWEADAAYRKGNVKLDVPTPAPAIAGTDEDVLYQTYLSSTGDLNEIRYEIPVTPGDYYVRLHFVENAFSTAGARVFSVRMESQLMLANLDIYQEVGAKAALVKDFTITSDGTLNISFNPSVNRLALAGVEIFRSSTNPIAFTVTTTQVGCTTSADATATVDTLTGGIAPYTYSWNTTPVQTSATATGLSEGSYAVTVTDVNGCAKTQTLTVTKQTDCPAATGFDLVASQPTLTLYPNPTNSRFTVELDGIRAVDVNATKITNEIGIVRLQNSHKITGEYTLEIDISSLKPGSYLLQITAGDQTHVVRIIKNFY